MAVSLHDINGDRQLSRVDIHIHQTIRPCECLDPQAIAQTKIAATLEIAGRIGEFMAKNIAIDIEFEEYETSELPQYEKDDAPDN